jgi:N-methylhydantoinase A
MKYRMGIDVGGTFTDLYLLTETGDREFTLKVPSTPDDPSRAIVSGVTALLERHGIRPADVAYLSHGTTVATNTILQHSGAKVGLVTTAGFRDLLEIGRQKRPSVYDLFADKPLVLVPRPLRREVDERVSYDGQVITKLKAKQLKDELRDLLSSDIAALAICFLHSYANPAHEQMAKNVARSLSPKTFLSVSHELTSEFREYERFLTAVLNAYVGPRLGDYLTHLQSSLRDIGLVIDPYIIQSNGGLMSIRGAAEVPVRTVLSGPSAGVVGAAHVARQAGCPNIITLDMGGTSTDVSLLRDAKPNMEAGQRISGYPIRVPAIAIHTIGAGGGSIAWTDDAMGFHVGPRSAGAVPGPAAYGLGGDQPTVTDANILLGRLSPKGLLGGAMPVYPERAEKAVDVIAKRLKLTRERTASGILQIVTSAMVRAVRVISVEKGEDPRDFALMAFGGAGALHASAVARQLGMTRVFIPTAPGLLCSMGALLAAPTMEYTRTKVLGTDQAAEIGRIFDDLKAQARQWLAHEHVTGKARRLQYSVDMRYVGQNHELTVSLPEERITAKALAEAAAAFHREHDKQFGYCSPDDAVQVVSCRVVATGVATRITTVPPAAGQGQAVPRSRRPVYFETDAVWVDCPIYWRDDLSPGETLQGPAIVEQLDATTVMYPGDVGQVDAFGNIMVTVGREPAEGK